MYKYSSTCTEDLVIRTPRLESQGVYENKDNATQALNGYSLGLKIPSSDDNKEFYDLLLEVTEIIKTKMKKVESSLRKTKKKEIMKENLEIVKYRNDGSVVTYPKLYTDKNMSITSTFYRVATRSEVNKGLGSQERPIISVEAKDYINTPIEVVVGIRITGVFVSSAMETIRLRTSEVIVRRKIPKETICSKDNKGIFSKDLGIEPIEDKDEDDDSE